MFWAKSAARSDPMPGCPASAASESSRVANELMSTSGRRAPVAARSEST